MTEQEWDASPNRRDMLQPLRGKVSDRKLRLFACGCCRRIWHLMADTRCKEAIEVAEQYADGLNPPGRLRAASAATADEHRPEGADFYHWAAWVAAHDATDAFALRAAAQSWFWVGEVTLGPNHAAKNMPLAALLRDIFPNPFRPPPVRDPRWADWNDGALPRLAAAAYEERVLPRGDLDPARLVVLADALEAAGATGEIIAHLRGPGPHVRGCWAVDLILGKE